MSNVQVSQAGPQEQKPTGQTKTTKSTMSNNMRAAEPALLEKAG